MVYLVTNKQELFEDPDYKIISAEESINKISSWDIIQFDTETSGRDPHICHLLCAQFGNDAADEQIVVDCESVKIEKYKNLLESKVLILQNGKFDLQFLYNHRIIPLKIWDTMVVEQLLYLGYPAAGKPGGISYALNAIADRRLGVNIDKTVRGEIIWRGLDKSVIMYAAGDVTYLEKIRKSQIEDCKKKDCIKAALLENRFVPVIAYLEWCGIKLDEKKWRTKMEQDQQNLIQSEKALNDFVLKTPFLSKFTFIDRQGDLFEGFNTTPIVDINWSSSQQVIKVAKILGFDTTVQDKKSGEDKDSVLEKHLKTQKGINDEFLNLYFKYQEYAKVVSSFGQGHLDAINPITGRLHTSFKQLGAASGRMSCGSTQPNTDLAHYKKIAESRCKYVNLQQLPANEETRSAFIAEPGNMFVSCDYKALESRLGADIYQEQSMIDEYLHGSGDIHSLCAYMVYKEIPRDTPIKDIEDLYPHLRKAAKPIEFSQQFGGSEFAIQSSMGCTIEEARAFKQAYDTGFAGIAKFKAKGSRFVKQNGYVLMNQSTGHKMYWWDWEDWKKQQARYDSPGFWDEYKSKHKGTGDAIALEVKHHFQAASKWERMALNAPTQCTGICCLKLAMTNLFNWILENGYFNKIKLCALVHDEACLEYPKELKDFPKILEKFMEDAAAVYCKSVPIPAKAAVGDHWIH